METRGSNGVVSSPHMALSSYVAMAMFICVILGMFIFVWRTMSFIRLNEAEMILCPTTRSDQHEPATSATSTPSTRSPRSLQSRRSSGCPAWPFGTNPKLALHITQKSTWKQRQVCLESKTIPLEICTVYFTLPSD